MVFFQPIFILATLSASVCAYPLGRRVPQDIPSTTATGVQQCNGTAMAATGAPLATATSFAGAAAMKYALRDDTEDDDGCDDGGDESSSILASATPSEATPPDATATDASVSASVVTSVDATATEAATGTVTASAPAATSSDSTGDDGGDDGCDDGGDESSSVVVASTATAVGGASATDVGASSVALSSVATAATATATDVTGAGAGDSATATAPAATSTSTSTSGSSTQQQNAEAAQKLNAQFESMTASDSCTEGSQACVPDNGSSAFAQCVSGQWVLTPCASGNQCFALPLVNSAGTTLACTTTSDAQSRFANAGATGGVDGKSN